MEPASAATVGTAPRAAIPLRPAARDALVQRVLQRAPAYKAAAAREGSPLYLLELPVLRRNAEAFTQAFASHLPRVAVYYAVKCNPHGAVLRTLSKAGIGLDVSSGLELSAALEAGSRAIVFSGPGKTLSELSLTVPHTERVTVLIDSFRELERLESLAGSARKRIRAGVRLSREEQGFWRKFGIPLASLPAFLEAAQGCAHVDVRGLQFHTSWNLSPDAQVAFLQRLGPVLASLPEAARAEIEFVDIGGGFWPQEGEWLHRPDGIPLDEAALTVGAHGDGDKSGWTTRSETGPRASAVTHDQTSEEPHGSAARAVPEHFVRPAAPIGEFARAIGEAARRWVFPHLDCTICVEPGRWLVHDAMQILVTVVDRKAPDLVITDAGTNAVGWERFEQDYVPVVNLSQPDSTERSCLIMGSLCTPHDLWGLSYCGSAIGEGDLLLIPSQGAYTYTLRQQFIKPLPRVAILEA